MKTLAGSATICLFSATLVALLLPACSSSDGGAPNTAAAGGSSTPPTGDATRGAALWVDLSLGCNTCHGERAEGGAAPNITKSVTGGIGAFTYAQFHAAVRERKNKEGGLLCIAMNAIPTSVASEQDIADLYAFQQAQPAVDTPAARPLYCLPPEAHCCTGESVK